ncbi:hypothetical protein [Paraburkholderia elongata]|nr:hypothetical protein [Paraburkholderia elongata]
MQEYRDVVGVESYEQIIEEAGLTHRPVLALTCTAPPPPPPVTGGFVLAVDRQNLPADVPGCRPSRGMARLSPANPAIEPAGLAVQFFLRVRLFTGKEGAAFSESAMSTKVDTGFRFVTHQMHPIAMMMEAVKSGIEQLQRRRYLAAYASILVSILDRTQLAREAGHSRGMVMAKPGSVAREAILRRQARARATRERDPVVDIGVVLRCWHSQLLDRVIGYVAGAFGQEIMGLLKEVGIATGYAFWASGAPDDAVSPQEWSQRRAAWQQALDGQSGEGIEFRYDGESMDLSCPWSELEPYVPSLESRARELAEPALFSRWYESLPPKGDDGEHIWKRHAQFRDLLNDDPAMRAALAADVERLKPKLLTGVELDAARRREQLVLLPAGFA